MAQKHFGERLDQYPALKQATCNDFACNAGRIQNVGEIATDIIGIFS